MSALPSPGDQAIQVGVARTMNELLEVVALRSVVYMAEQQCPYEEEFDGNDFAGATHLVARIDSRAVGVMRIRWFALFAKVERAAVLPGVRGGAVTAALVREARGIIARKGYRKALAHIQTRLAPLWRRYGDAKPREDRPTFVFSDHIYAEVEFDVDPPPDALTMDSPPLLLLRPEGAWDRPGVLEHSAARLTSMPGVNQGRRNRVHVAP